MTLITTAELARRTGKTEQTIRNHARNRGIRPLYGFTAEDAERILRSIELARPGKPRPPLSD